MSLQTLEEELRWIEDAMGSLMEAVHDAQSKHSPFNSVYEGAYFIHAELNELMGELKERHLDVQGIRDELWHIIVCCLRTDAALAAQAKGEDVIPRRDLARRNLA